MNDIDGALSLPEPPDRSAGASASERHRTLLRRGDVEALADVPLADLLGPLDAIETTAVSNWRRGAEGERSTAQLLAPLGHIGWGVLHDRRIPGTDANIDHLVIGPSAVWVIDSKSYRGRIKVLGDGRLWYGRNCLDNVLQTVQWAAGAVEDRLGSELVDAGLVVRPALCIHGARLPRSPFDFDGVLLATSDTLLQSIAAGEPAFPTEEADRLTAVAAKSLPSACRHPERREP